MAIRNTKNQTVNISTSDNMSVDVISITEDCLRVVLITHINKIKKSKDIIGAIALFVTLLIVVITSDFNDRKVWYGIFIVLFIASIFYLVYVGYNLWKNRDSIDNIIEDIKKSKAGSLTGVILHTPIKKAPKKSKSKSKSKSRKKK